MDTIVSFEMEYLFLIPIVVHIVLYLCVGRLGYKYSSQLDIIYDAEWAMHICLGSGVLLNAIVGTTMLISAVNCYYMTFWPTLLFCIQMISQHIRSLYCAINMIFFDTKLKNTYIWVIFFLLGVAASQATAFSTIDGVQVSECLGKANMCYIPVSITSTCVFMGFGLLSSMVQLVLSHKHSHYLFLETCLLAFLQNSLMIVAVTVYILSMQECRLEYMPVVRMMMVFLSFTSIIPAILPCVYLNTPYYIQRFKSMFGFSRIKYEKLPQDMAMEIVSRPCLRDLSFKGMKHEWNKLNMRLDTIKDNSFMHVNLDIAPEDIVLSVLICGQFAAFLQNNKLYEYLTSYFVLLKFKSVDYKTDRIQLQDYNKICDMLLGLAEDHGVDPKFPAHLIKPLSADNYTVHQIKSNTQAYIDYLEVLLFILVKEFQARIFADNESNDEL